MRPERRGKMAQTSGQKGRAHPLAVVELVAGFVAGAVGLGSALLFLSRPGTQPLREAVVFLTVIVLASIGVGIGAYQHANRTRRSDLFLLWTSTVLAVTAAVWSALSPILVVFGLITLVTALLGTWRQVQARAPAEPGSDRPAWGS